VELEECELLTTCCIKELLASCSTQMVH